MNAHSKIFFLTAIAVPNIIAGKPTHQTAGLPKSAIEDLMLIDSWDTYNHTGFNIKGQLHHSDEKKCVASRVE